MAKRAKMRPPAPKAKKAPTPPLGVRMAGTFRRFFTETEEDRAHEDELDPPRPFIEHFIDLRNCIVRSVLAWGAGMLIVAPFAPWVMHALQRPLAQAGLEGQVIVQGLDVTAGFNIFMSTMLWGGTILALPAILCFLAQFIFPGLKRHERNLILFVLSIGLFLFVGGVWLCYGFTLRLALQMLIAFNAWMNVPTTILEANAYVSIILKILLAFGLAFQFPLILLALGWLGIIRAETLRRHRGGAIILIFTIAMFLTPPDILSQIIMAVPMCILYEITIWLVRLRERLADDTE